MEVRSRPGRGSVFIISLPRVTAAVPGTVDAPVAGASRARLMVCGEAVERRELLGMLESWGYPCDQAGADTGLADVLEHRPDVVICLSECLPALAQKLDGVEHPPLVIAVGVAEDGIPPGLTVDGRLNRPVRPARLRALLHHLLIEESDAAPNS